MIEIVFAGDLAKVATEHTEIVCIGRSGNSVAIPAGATLQRVSDREVDGKTFVSIRLHVPSDPVTHEPRYSADFLVNRFQHITIKES